MAATAFSQLRVITGGADGATGNGGYFDIGQTAGMLTDGAATLATSTAPVFTSASYSFVSGDIGASVYIASGTNWIPGWYIITAVGSGAATLNAAIGSVTIGTPSLTEFGINTTAGCATTASPTAATWSMDYSLSTAPYITYSDLTAVGAGSTFTSVLNPFGKQLVGNSIAVSSGINVTVQRVVITSVSGITATFDAAVSTGATVNGAGKLGGSLASPGQASALALASNFIWIKYNATPYSITTTSSGPGSTMSIKAGTQSLPSLARGFDVIPGDKTANRPTLQIALNTGGTALANLLGLCAIENIILDGNRTNFPTAPGGPGIIAGLSNTSNMIRDVKVTGFLQAGISFTTNTGATLITNTEVTDCVGNGVSGAGASFGLVLSGCYVHDNPSHGLSYQATTGSLVIHRSIFANNKSSSSFSHVVITSIAKASIFDSDFYNSGTHAIDLQFASVTTEVLIKNCYIEAAGGYGITAAAVGGEVYIIKPGFFGNVSGNYPPLKFLSKNIEDPKILSSSAFVAAGSGNFAINNTAGAGALLRLGASPSIFPGSNTNNYQDIGAAQSKFPASTAIPVLGTVL